ncbi:hypothetical protein PAA47_002642 [Salmonella enterica]|nr:hypothetical protein [Salmonella enterica]
MKKSMAGQGAAGALLLAGLMMSAGAMAVSGDPVTGGVGHRDHQCSDSDVHLQCFGAHGGESGPG